jgi:hypothetical protein
MRMSKPILTTAAAASLVLASCIPPPDVPPPRFKPNPPYPPQQVDPYGLTPDPYGASPDPYGQSPDPAPPPEPPVRPGEYPTARKTVKPNEVISPYEPYNVIDVEGFSSGQLARDPSNNKIFRVP